MDLIRKLMSYVYLIAWWGQKKSVFFFFWVHNKKMTTYISYSQSWKKNSELDTRSGLENSCTKCVNFNMFQIIWTCSDLYCLFFFSIKKVFLFLHLCVEHSLIQQNPLVESKFTKLELLLFCIVIEIDFIFCLLRLWSTKTFTKTKQEYDII